MLLRTRALKQGEFWSPGRKAAQFMVVPMLGRRGTPGIEGVEARDAAEHPTMQGTAPGTKNHPAAT